MSDRERVPASDGTSSRSRAADRIAAGLLLAVLAAAAVTATAVLMAPAGIAGAAHPRVPGLRAGAPAGTADPPTTLVVLAGLAVLGAAALLLALGTRRGAGRRAALAVFAASLPAALSFAAVALTHARDGAAAPLVLGLPLPVAWMLLGVWLAPAAFAAVYVAGFARWFVGEDAEALLRELGPGEGRAP